MNKETERRSDPECLEALVFCWIWAVWQVFIIAPLISHRLGEGHIFWNICNILTATCLAADPCLFFSAPSSIQALEGSSFWIKTLTETQSRVKSRQKKEKDKYQS